MTVTASTSTTYDRLESVFQNFSRIWRFSLFLY